MFPRKSRGSSLEILKNLLRKNKNINFNINEFLALFLDIIDIIYQFNEEINRVFNYLEYNYSHDIISDLYIKLLNQNSIISNKKYDFVVQHVIEFLTYSREINPNENYYIYLLSHVKLNHIKIKIFDQFKQKIINKEEIFDYNFSENLKLLSQLIKKGYFSEKSFVKFHIY